MQIRNTGVSVADPKSFLLGYGLSLHFVSAQDPDIKQIHKNVMGVLGHKFFCHKILFLKTWHACMIRQKITIC